MLDLCYSQELTNSATATAEGRKFLFRTGAAFVSARLGISPIAPISPAGFNSASKGSEVSSAGGLIIAGSYVPKTTAQLAALRESAGDQLTTIELDVERLLASEDARNSEVAKAVKTAEENLSKSQDVLVMTSRKLITGATGAESLDIGGVVAKVLVSFLEQLQIRPRYLIAKVSDPAHCDLYGLADISQGGITSSDMATKGLKMRRARVVGQAAAGVPLWRCDEERSKFKGLPYVVFPGNVGTADTLYEVVERWRS